MLKLANPQEVRARIDSITEDIVIPRPSAKFPNGVMRIDAETIKTTDRICLLGGFRIDEVVTKHWSGDGNTSDTLTLELDEEKVTGEEVLIIKVNSLKKLIPVERKLGLPFDSYHEPYSKLVWEAWQKNEGNPCDVNRGYAWAANSRVFEGLGYKVKARAIYATDENGKFLRTESGRKIVSGVVPEHLKQGTNHFLRHVRTMELSQLQFTMEERISFFKWSTSGAVAMAMTYHESEWFEYFPKFLKRRF